MKFLTLSKRLMTNDNHDNHDNEKIFEKNCGFIRRPQCPCRTFASSTLRDGICAPTRKNLRAHGGGKKVNH